VRTNIFLAGVGGQGILSFARVLGELALIRNMNVLIGETHGMAQRGGSVTATVRYGEVYSPIIGIGKADLLIGFEPLESARYARILSPDGMAIVNTSRIIPYSVSAQKTKYPDLEDLLAIIGRHCDTVVAFDATHEAEKVKFPLAANSVMVGAAAATMKIDATPDDFKKAIRKVVPRKIKENLDAFAIGYDIAKNIIEGHVPGPSDSKQ
jgi:indolepyruvate ferredoxin oxidoreductase beta subunit